jgi:hypothetical protein
MLTLTAILFGLMVLGNLSRLLDRKMDKGSDVLGLMLGIALHGIMVWQFYFRLLPLAWGGGE